MSLFWQLLCCSLLFAGAHPIYVSTTEIHYRPDRQALEIQVKFFSDDMQEVLQQINADSKVEIGTARERPQDEKALAEYVQKQLQLHWNGEKLSLQYLGKETERDDFYATYVYLEVKNISAPQAIQIQQSLLLKHIARQQNIVHLFIHQRNGDKQVKRFNFYKGKDHASVSF